MRKWLAIVLVLFSLGFIKAQSINFTAEVDTNKILIGDQITLQLKASLSKENPYLWPVFPDTIEGLELVGASKLDTSKKNGNWTLTQKLLITSFDSGYFVLPPFTFSSNGQSVSTEAIGIAVGFPELSEEQDYFDIKDPLSVQRNWWTILWWSMGILGILALISLSILILIRRKRGLRKTAPKIVIPPYEEALKELEKLEAEQLWQKGEIKIYYSRVSDILRAYIQKQLGIPAMENTAEEVIESLMYENLPSEYFAKLKQMLRLSSLVKFAKAKPSPSENEIATKLVREFVELTRPRPSEEKAAEDVE
jgi:hypothetical protein